MNSSSIYITTSIPYVNAAAHVGHAQEFILTDALARLYRIGGRKVTFQTGTDENAFKNVLSARSQNLDPSTLVTQNATKFRELEDRLQISYGTFIRTTEERHHKGVHLFWQSLDKQDLFDKSYRGLYCQGCEDFYAEKDLVNGLCPDHLTAPTTIEENNVFFRLSKYQQDLEQLIESDTIKITPSFRKAEILNFIRGGLQDISLTRDAARSANWGIKVPGEPKQVIYVWIDALVNYLTGQGYGDGEDWRQAWNESTHKVHVIGKNVWKFHAVYWPALLLSAGLPLPNEIIIHGFLTANGLKISKSLGNAVDPVSVINQFGTDALRNYLLSELSLFADADFSEKSLAKAFNENLSNNLGNLVSRLAALCRKADFAPVITRAREHELEIYPEQLRDNSRELWNRLSRINAEINSTRPWELIKNGESKSAEKLIQGWVQEVHDVCQLLHCFLPTASAQVTKLLEAGIESHEGALFPRFD